MTRAQLLWTALVWVAVAALTLLLMVTRCRAEVCPCDGPQCFCHEGTATFTPSPTLTPMGECATFDPVFHWIECPTPTPLNICDVFHEQCMTPPQPTNTRSTPTPTPMPECASFDPVFHWVACPTATPTPTIAVDCANEAGWLTGCPVCWADQDNSRTVTVDELTTVIARAVDGCGGRPNPFDPASVCWGDRDSNNRITMDELIIVLVEALEGCNLDAMGGVRYEPGL